MVADLGSPEVEKDLVFEDSEMQGDCLECLQLDLN